MWSKCGECPRCGAPLYHKVEVPGQTTAVPNTFAPPQVYRTCNCVFGQTPSTPQVKVNFIGGAV
jgi:hypothetical protein